MKPKFSMKRKRNILPKLAITSFLSLIFTALFAFRGIEPEKSQNEKEAVVAVTQTLKSDAVQKTKIIYKCGHERNEAKRIEDRFIGKTKEETEKIAPDLSVTFFSPEEVDFEKNLGEDCQNHFIIRLSENKICVFRTNDESTVYKARDINVNDLSNEDMKILTEGIRVDSELELLEMMESFS